jgi:hypothetical protein
MKAKATREILEQKHHMLKLTLSSLANDNTYLKSKYEALQLNVKKGKQQLQDYLSTITDKQTAVNNLNKQIQYFQLKLQELQNKTKVVNNNNKHSEENHCVNEQKFKKKERQFKVNKDNYYEFCSKQKQLIDEIKQLRRVITNYNEQKEEKDKYNIMLIKQDKTNLNDFFEQTSIDKFKILNKNKNNKEEQNDSKKIVYMVDKKGKVWKFIQRKDLDINDVIENKLNEVVSVSMINEEKCKHIIENDFECNNNNNNEYSDANLIDDSKQYTKVIKYKKVNDMLKDTFIL